MNSRIVGLRVASGIFGLACLAHAWRLVVGFKVTIGSHEIPYGISMAGLVVAGLLCGWLWRLSLAPRLPPPAL